MKRSLEGISGKIVFLIAGAYALFHLCTAGLGTLPDIQQPAMHALLGFIIVFACWGANPKEACRKYIPFYDILLILLAMGACLNVIVNHEEFLISPYDYTNIDLFFSVCIILLILEAARRTVGWILPSLAAAMILYSWYRGGSLEFVLVYIYHFDLGVWGMLTMISATVVAVFLIFGSFLLNSGGGETFVEISTKLSGRYRGGPAKIAVVASSLFGMLSGSPVANTATTGNFTIPLMKKVGYKPEVAGAIEAAASTGGMLVPPVMGAAAFIMAELLEVSYLQICIYAIIPSVLFYVSVFCYVHFEAIRTNIQPTGKVEGSYRDFLVWSKFGPLFVPLAFFVFFLIQGYTALFAAFSAVIISIVCYLLKGLNPQGIKERVRYLPNIFYQGGKAVAYLMPLLLCAQIVVGMLGQSGLGVEVASLITSLGENSRVFALILAALLTILLGMGVPPVGAYVLAVSVTTPALLNLQVDPVAAHMFSFSFAAFAAITPPVCAAVFVGASIADAPWLRSGFQAMKVAAVAYILPFSYTMGSSPPYLLGIGSNWMILLSLVCALLGAVSLSGALVGALFHGRISFIPRLFLGFGGICMIINLTWVYTIIGACMIFTSAVFIFFFDKAKRLAAV